VPAVRVGAIPGIAAPDKEDAVDDEAAGADVIEADLAVDAVEQWSADAGKSDQGRIGACRRRSSSKRARRSDSPAMAPGPATRSLLGGRTIPRSTGTADRRA